MSKLLAAIKKYLSLIFIYLFNLFPIKNNRIFLFSYYGSQYGDSPKYITEYILEHYPKSYFDIVWAFNDPKSKNDLDFRKVKTMSFRYFYELCTSKVVITNFRTTDLFVKRKNQYYIQTWHSSLRLKQIEKDAEGELPLSYVEMAKKDSMKCDLLLSGCKYSTEIFKRAFWYNGLIFEHGTPANDLLVTRNKELSSEVRKRLDIPNDYKIALYAPTFRNATDLSAYDLDYEGAIRSLKKKFGGKWVFLLRLHPHLMNISKQIDSKEYLINATTYDDVQELLLVSDVVFTDYSSVMFSYQLTKRPCFLYVPDLDEYIKKDRKLYFNLKELPFIYATGNKGLQWQIENFDYQQYKNNLTRFLDRICSYEVGCASERLLRHLDEVCFGVNTRRGRNEAI